MSSIDKRIVQMQFDNQGFQKGVNDTVKSLKTLNENLKMKSSTNGLTDVNSAFNKLNNLGLASVSTGIDKLTQRFSAFGIMSMTALMNLTNTAVDFGKRITKAFTIEPITTGFSEYETKMNAIQTILTNTESKGTTLDDVTKVLDELNKYADQTIYNFAEMTKNIGTFTAAGVDLETSALAIKGIANLAAGSGSNAQQASTAMYQLSQALAAGKVSLMDWNSVVNAGMGGELFQNALKDTAKSMGIYVDASKPFRETLQDGWLTTDVLIKTLEQFANDDSLIKAATEVKTFTQMIDTMKESVQSGWATSWEHIIGDKEEAATLFTSISEGFNSIIGPSADARNEMLRFWNANGGRQSVINGITNVIKELSKILGSIGDAWNEVFPPLTGGKITALSAKFEMFTKKIKVSDETIKQVKTTFKGLFESFVLVKDGVVAVVKSLTPLKDVFDGLGSWILDVTSNIGEFILKLREMANEGDFFGGITEKLGGGIRGIADFILNLREYIGILIGYLSNLEFGNFFKAIGDGFKQAFGFLEPVFQSIADVIGKIDLNTVFGMIKTGTAIKIVQELRAMLEEAGNAGEDAKGLFDKVVNSFKSFGDLGSAVGELLGTLKDSLLALQNEISARALMKLAGAVALLSLSLLLIASIDTDKLVNALLGLAVVMGELVLVYLAISNIGMLTGIWKLGTALITFAVAIGILTSALKEISEIDTDKMASGLIGLTAMIGLAALSMKILSKNTKATIKSSLSLIVFAQAIRVMAKALEEIGSINPEVVGQGLTAMAVLLGELALFMMASKFGNLSLTSATSLLILSGALLVLGDAVKNFGSLSPEQIILGLSSIALILAEIALFSKVLSGMKMATVGIGLAIVSASLILLSKALESMGSLDWDEIGKGLTGIAGALVILCAASLLTSGAKLAVVGVGVGVMAASLLVLSLALKSFGNMSWEEIGKGLTVLAGSLLILSVAMYAMSAGLVGAAAMVVVAGALAILTPQLLLLSQMSLAEVGIALLSLAGAFTVLGLAGLLLTPVVPTLLLLSGAIALIGAGALMCGAGLTMIGTGIAAIGVAVGGSGILIVEFLNSLIKLIPKIATKLGEGFVAFADSIVQGAPVILEAFRVMLLGMLNVAKEVIPEIINTALTIVLSFIQALETYVPQIVEAGAKLILGVLQGIAEHIGEITTAAIDIVVNFTNAVAEKLPEVIDAGINLALSFITGVAEGIINHEAELTAAIQKVIEAVISIAKSLLTGFGLMEILKAAGEFIMGLVNGVKEKWPEIKQTMKDTIDGAVEAVGDLGDDLVQAGKDLIQGLINGIKSMVGSAVSAAINLASDVVSAAKSMFGINSPSKVFMEIGRYNVEGLTAGLDKYGYEAVNSASNLSNRIIDSVKNPLSNLSKILDDDMDATPVITPVLDLTSVKNGAKMLNDMINTNPRAMVATVGTIQNKRGNEDVVSALRDLKDNLSNGTNVYNVNGITYDDGSNVTKAVETLVRAAKIERRL